MPTPTGRPRSQFFEEQQIPLQNTARHTCARSEVGAEATPGRESAPRSRPPDRRAMGNISDATSLGAETRSWQGRGGGAPMRTFHARRQLPAQSGFVWSSCLAPPPRAGAVEPPGRARRGGEAGAPRPRRSPARRVSAVGCRAPGAALRQPSHRGARVPLPGLSWERSGGA